MMIQANLVALEASQDTDRKQRTRRPGRTDRILRHDESGCLLRRPDCRQKTFDLLLQAFGLFSEFTRRTEDQFGSGSDLA